MTGADLAYMAGCAVVIASVALAVRDVRQSVPQEPTEASERTDDHSRIIEALRFWLSDESIARVIMDQRVSLGRSFVMGRAFIDMALASLDRSPEESLWALTRALLADRAVRVAIGNVERSKGVKGWAMADVLQESRLYGREAS